MAEQLVVAKQFSDIHRAHSQAAVRSDWGRGEDRLVPANAMEKQQKRSARPNTWGGPPLAPGIHPRLLHGV